VLVRDAAGVFNGVWFTEEGKITGSALACIADLDGPAAAGPLPSACQTFKIRTLIW